MSSWSECAFLVRVALQELCAIPLHKCLLHSFDKAEAMLWEVGEESKHDNG